MRKSPAVVLHYIDVLQGIGYFESDIRFLISQPAFLGQVFDGNEREEELDKLRALMEDNWSDAHEFELEVEAQKEVDKRMELHDLDIDEVRTYYNSGSKRRSLGCVSSSVRHGQWTLNHATGCKPF